MTKSEVKKALDEIRDMSDEEIADNGRYIRKVAEEAFALIKILKGGEVGWLIEKK